MKTMLEITITASVLIAVLLMLRLMLRRNINPMLQYALWLLVAVRLMLPFSLFSSSVSVMNALSLPDVSIESINAERGTNHTGTESPGEIIEGTDGFEAEFASLDVASTDTARRPSSLESKLRLIWLIGAVSAGLWLLISNLRLYIHLRTRRTIFPSSCRRPVYIVPALPSPCLFSGSIYITQEIAEDSARLPHVLAHELAHFRHRDELWGFLRGILLAVYWYNPFVWTAAWCSKLDGELACDESAIRSLGEMRRFDYGRTLVSLIAVRRGNLLSVATTMTGSSRSIKERIAMIAKKPKTLRVTSAAVILIAAVAAGCTFTGPKEETDSFDAVDIYGTYSFSECLYINMASSYYPFEGTGQYYLIREDGIAFVAEDDGTVTETISGGWTQSEFDTEEYESMFSNGEGTDISEYSERIQLENGDHIIFVMDGEVWLAKLYENDKIAKFFWSIYLLEKTEQAIIDGFGEQENAPAGTIMYGIDVPETVLEAAKEQTEDYFASVRKDYPEYSYTDWRIESLEYSYTYDDLNGQKLIIYRMNYEFLSESPEKIILAGGMYITDGNWVCTSYPNCTYLIFLQDGENLSYLFAMMENDTGPGEELFTEDLRRALSIYLTDAYEYSFLVDGKWLSLWKYYGDFPWYYSLTEISRKTWDSDGFHNVNHVVCDDLELTYMQAGEENEWALTFIATISSEISTFRGIACGMSEADLLKAYGSDIQFSESYADNGNPIAEYDYIYGYAPAEDNTCNHIVFLMKEGVIAGIEMQNLIDGRLFQ